MSKLLENHLKVVRLVEESIGIKERDERILKNLKEARSCLQQCSEELAAMGIQPGETDDGDYD